MRYSIDDTANDHITRTWHRELPLDSVLMCMVLNQINRHGLREDHRRKQYDKEQQDQHNDESFTDGVADTAEY